MYFRQMMFSKQTVFLGGQVLHHSLLFACTQPASSSGSYTSALRTETRCITPMTALAASPDVLRDMLAVMRQTQNYAAPHKAISALIKVMLDELGNRPDIWLRCLPWEEQSTFMTGNATEHWNRFNYILLYFICFSNCTG